MRTRANRGKDQILQGIGELYSISLILPQYTQIILVKDTLLMKRLKSHKHTLFSCYIGYITQAILNNLTPLLFLTFRKEYGLSLKELALLTTVNFCTQLTVDFLSTKFVDRIGYRSSAVLAHTMAVLGLCAIPVLPVILPNPLAGLILAVIIYAIGGGILEVIVSPIVEACPTERKEAVMSLLHSFYCWGQVGVVLLSTLFFTLVGLDRWKMLFFIAAIIPFFNLIYFTKVPIYPLVFSEKGLSIKNLLSGSTFWILLLLMICAGASELSMSQWASAFAESGLHINKTAGDLAGPCTFALLMGFSRVLFARYSTKISLEKAMTFSAILCIVSYLIAALSSNAVLSLAGCALCGFSVGIFWPGTFSIASKTIRNGGTAMFAFMALAGDIGCSVGPAFVGIVSANYRDDLHKGLFVVTIFPVILLIILACAQANRHFQKYMETNRHF
jgi:MFS family permease